MRIRRAEDRAREIIKRVWKAVEDRMNEENDATGTNKGVRAQRAQTLMNREMRKRAIEERGDKGVEDDDDDDGDEPERGRGVGVGVGVGGVPGMMAQVVCTKQKPKKKQKKQK